MLLVLFLDGEVENVLLVTGRQAGEDGDHAEEARLGAVLLGVHGDEKGAQPATKGLDADLQVVEASAHGGGDEVLVLQATGAGVLGDEVFLVGNVRAADGEGSFGDSHAVLEGESDITDAVPHGVDLEKLAVGGEALHLFLPEDVVAERDVASAVEQASDEIVDGGGGEVELLLLGAVHGLDADLRLEKADELGADGRASGHGCHGGDLLHGGKANLFQDFVKNSRLK